MSKFLKTLHEKQVDNLDTIYRGITSLTEKNRTVKGLINLLDSQDDYFAQAIDRLAASWAGNPEFSITENLEDLNYFTHQVVLGESCYTVLHSAFLRAWVIKKLKDGSVEVSTFLDILAAAEKNAQSLRDLDYPITVVYAVIAEDKIQFISLNPEMKNTVGSVLKVVEVKVKGKFAKVLDLQLPELTYISNKVQEALGITLKLRGE